MPHRVREILLVSSAYHAFILQEDGLLEEQVFFEYKALSLSSAPTFTHVTTGAAALEALADRWYDLILVAGRVPDMGLQTFAQQVGDLPTPNPLVVLAFDPPDVRRLQRTLSDQGVDAVFLWSGNAQILLAIVKYVEDLQNLTNDIEVADVGVILVIEEYPENYSALLTSLYPALMKQSQSLFAEGLNQMQRLIRMRTRPKVVHVTSEAAALEAYELYQDNIMAVICGVGFQARGRHDPEAGLRFAQWVRTHRQDVPVLLQVADDEHLERAREAATVVLDRRSPRMLAKIRDFLAKHLGFGDFVFITPDGTEVGRAKNIAELAETLRVVPDASLDFHSSRNHFSVWLMARSEFTLAHRLKNIDRSEFTTIQNVRIFLIQELETLRLRRRIGVIHDASPTAWDPDSQFQRLGRGSIGGKARGIAFLDHLLASDTFSGELAGLPVRVPQSFALTTDAFEEFLEQNALDDLLQTTDDDEVVLARCLAAHLPKWVQDSLHTIVDHVDGPLAVRSSSLLEDNLMHPFAGIYGTAMLPNSATAPEIRLRELHQAVKYVYATTFFANARAYVANTSRSIEEERMGVLIQRLVGQRYGDRFYPHFAGVVRSHNYYPVEHQEASDGVAQLVLGLGAMVVEGGRTLRFCPRYPEVIPGFGDPRQVLTDSQKAFYALDMSRHLDPHRPDFESNPLAYPLEEAAQDGAIKPVGSIYDMANNRIVEGPGLQGPWVVTFNNLLVHRAIPLAEALTKLLQLSVWAMGTDVELELACDMGDWGRRVQRGQRRRHPELFLLQLRPAVTQDLATDVANIPLADTARVFCHTTSALGHGVYSGIRDLVYVRQDAFDPAVTRDIAQEVGLLNGGFAAERRPYILIGPGRWGSSDPWLGVPVQWSQISAARIIVESSPKGYDVDPSQGAHFFHNMTALGIGYLTIPPGATRAAPIHDSFMDWDWLDAQPAVRETAFLRHLHLSDPFYAVLDGRASEGTLAG